MKLKVQVLPNEVAPLTQEDTELAKQIFQKVKDMEFSSFDPCESVARILSRELQLVGLDYVEDSLLVRTVQLSHERDGNKYIKSSAVTMLSALVIRPPGSRISLEG